MTEKGLEMIENSLPLRHEALSKAMGCFSEAEIKTFTDYIRRALDWINHLTEQAEQKMVPTAQVGTTN